MPTDPAPDVDPRRIRIGVAILGVTFVVAVVLALIVTDPLGRTIMIAVTVVSFVRAALLIRSLRRR